MTRGVGGHGVANIMKHLKHIQFPADKQAILACARNGPGPNTRIVLGLLSRIPDRLYSSPSEIARVVGKIARSTTVNALTCALVVWSSL